MTKPKREAKKNIEHKGLEIGPERFETLIAFLKHWRNFLRIDFYDKCTGSAGTATRMLAMPHLDDALTEQDALLIVRTLRDLAEHAQVVADETEWRIIAKQYSGRPPFAVKMNKHYYTTGHTEMLHSLDIASYQNYVNAHRFNVPFERRHYPAVLASTINMVLYTEQRKWKDLEPLEVLEIFTSVTQSFTRPHETNEESEFIIME